MAGLGVGIPFRQCNCCHRWLPASEQFFHRHGSRSRPNIKWSYSCKACKTLRQRLSYARDKSKDRARWHAWYAKNRDYDSERGRAWRASHPEHTKERSHRWYEEHRPECRAAYRNYMARRRNAEGTHTADDVRSQNTRQRHRCYWCGANTKRRYHVDHVVPLILGGSNGPENLVISCPHCNDSKGAKHPMDFAGVLC